MTEQQENEIVDMQNYLQDEVEKTPNAYAERLCVLNTYMARTGILLAIAKKEYAEAVDIIYAKNMDVMQKLTPSQTKEYVKAKTAGEGFYVDLLDRMNSNCVHQSENLRTLLSYEKAQMQMI